MEYLRPRRDATPVVALRRLLSLDYVIDHLDAPWLPTDDDKVAAFTAAGRSEGRVAGPGVRPIDGSRRRHFVHRLPLAFDAERATFVFVHPEEETQSALRTWGGQHAGLWAALLAVGRTVDIVVVGRNPERLPAAGRVLDGWVSTTAAAGAHCEVMAAELAERARRDEEIASIRTAIATLDRAVLATYGGLNRAVARCARPGDGRARDETGKAHDLHRPDVAVSEGAGMSPVAAHPMRAVVVKRMHERRSPLPRSCQNGVETRRYRRCGESEV